MHPARRRISPQLRLVRGGRSTSRRPDTVTTAIRVLVVDDHPLIRDLIRFACQETEGLEVIGEAGSGQEALEECGRLCPDVVILDLQLPGMDGFEVARRLRKEAIPVRILVLTGSDDPYSLFECRRIGVDGYLEKTGALAEVIEAIRAVAGGDQTFNSQQERTVHKQLAELVRSTREARRVTVLLTARQLQVLELVSQGLSTRQVSSRLKISQRTAEAHIAKLYRKLGARTRLQAVTQAVRLGLLASGDGVEPQPASGGLSNHG